MSDRNSAKLKVRVENGKIVGDAPPGLPEGTELELTVADPGDDMSEEELAELNRSLEAAWRSVKEGRLRHSRRDTPQPHP